MQSTLKLEGERRGGVLNGSLLASTGETKKSRLCDNSADPHYSLSSPCSSNPYMIQFQQMHTVNNRQYVVWQKDSQIDG